jgi:hypothetical protein
MRLLKRSESSAPHLVTLVLRGGQLRLAVSLRGEMLWHRVVPLNPSFLEGGIISQPRAIANAIQAALAQAEFGALSRCVAALPGFHALSGVADVPASRDVQPSQVLPREARRLFSYRPEVSTLAWQPMSAVIPGMRRYVIVVTRRAALQSLREVIAMAGLQLLAVESSPLALARAANAGEGVVVQAESDGCEVVVLRNGTLGMLNSVYWGGDIVDQHTLAARVIDMAERSVAQHNQSNAAGPIAPDAPVFISGAASDMLGHLVADALRRPERKLHPPLKTPENTPIGELAVNIGMALREVR